MLTRVSLRIRVKTASKTLLQPLQCFASASDTQRELMTEKKSCTHVSLRVVILLDGRESWVIYSSSTILLNSFVSSLQMRTVHLKDASFRFTRRYGWGILSCGIIRCVIGYIVPVSTKLSCLTVRGLEVRTSRLLEMKTCSFETSGNRLSRDATTYSRRMVSFNFGFHEMWRTWPIKRLSASKSFHSMVWTRAGCPSIGWH
jgi:hypothetical protein